MTNRAVYILAGTILVSSVLLALAISGRGVAAVPDRPSMPLLDAVAAGNVEQTERNLYWCSKEKSCNLNSRSGSDPTPLLKAISRDDAQTAKLLVDAGADANYPFGQPLLSAGMTGAAKVAKVLIDARAAVDGRASSEGDTPLLMAAGFGPVQAGKMSQLGEPAAGVRSPTEWVAGHAETARVLIAGGAALEARGKDGNTPLFSAAATGQPEMVKVLIAAGADVNARDKTESSPLLVAAAGGHDAVVEALLDAKANTDARSTAGLYPLLAASGPKGSSNLVRLLVSHGADLKITGPGGLTALHTAAMFGSEDAATALIEAGADVNARAGDNSTPLRVASKSNHAGVADLIRAHGGVE